MEIKMTLAPDYLIDQPLTTEQKTDKIIELCNQLSEKLKSFVGFDIEDDEDFSIEEENLTQEQKKERIQARYSKLNITLKSYLKGKGFNKALKAFEFAKKRHPGYRKDDITPTFQHQIEICLYLMTLKEMDFEEETICAALLHDVREDPHEVNGKLVYVEHDEIKNLFIDPKLKGEDKEDNLKFAERVADAVEKLTKEFKGVKKDTQEYFDEIATCPIASLVKLADRIHNVSTMVGVFTIPKQDKYVYEIKTYFYPLIKKARENFPSQHFSYHSMNTFLKNMCKTVEAVLVAEKSLIKLKENVADLATELTESLQAITQPEEIATQTSSPAKIKMK